MWQPIETAPKDGTVVLLRERSWDPFEGYWDGEQWKPVVYRFAFLPTDWSPLLNNLEHP